MMLALSGSSQFTQQAFISFAVPATTATLNLSRPFFRAFLSSRLYVALVLAFVALNVGMAAVGTWAILTASDVGVAVTFWTTQATLFISLVEAFFKVSEVCPTAFLSLTISDSRP
jgi:hypothetical protein